MNTNIIAVCIALIGGVVCAAKDEHVETLVNTPQISLKFDTDPSRQFDIISTNMEDELVEEAMVVIRDSFDNASSEEGRVNYIATYFEKAYPLERWNVIESFGAIHYYSLKRLYIKKRYNLIWHTYLIYTV